MKKRNISERFFNEAKAYIPGGVDSPVRAFKAVGGVPPFISKGIGSKLYDEDGNRYIDYVCSWGPLILGHANPRIIRAILDAARRGTSFGAPSKSEITLAKIICQAIPSIEMIRFVNSGTEATMSAVRLARAYTGRDKIIKFSGCYHGHSDGLLAMAGSGLATFGIPASRGVPHSYTQNTLIARYNDISGVEALFRSYPEDIAAVIVEPVAANMGVVNPKNGFLDRLRQITTEHGSLLIFDEVITGFRLSYGGAQTIYNIRPDLTCLGKIIGGGLPVGAFGGRRDIMGMLAPVGPVYQAGTLSGNPLVMAAGIQTLRLLRSSDIYRKLESKAILLESGIRSAALKNNIKVHISRAGSMLTVFFTEKDVIDYETAQKSDTKRFARFFHCLLNEGIYWPPSQFETAFISTKHTIKDINITIRAIDKILASEYAKC